MTFLQFAGVAALSLFLGFAAFAAIFMTTACTGYVLGAFRFRRHGIIDPTTSWYRLVGTGASTFFASLRGRGGDFVVVGNKRIYRYGFHPEEEI